MVVNSARSCLSVAMDLQAKQEVLSLWLSPDCAGYPRAGDRGSLCFQSDAALFDPVFTTGLRAINGTHRS